MHFKSVEEILDFAISGEEESHRFYLYLASRVEKPHMKDIFEQFAKEELGHKAKLENFKKGKLLEPTAKKIMDLKIAEYVTDVEPEGNIDYQQALIIAMKKEKKAFKLYSDIAASVEDETAQITFEVLAQEEAKHKLRFEIEYDDHILSEN